MTPQERELIADLFDRLAELEDQPRDPEAERAIAEGLARAPHAIYPLVQTVLVQDEALKAANARIEALEGREGDSRPPRPAGFLDSMRDALFGRSEAQRGSVPSVRPGMAAAAAPPQAPYGEPYARAPSFLGTAAAAAAGMVGGALLLDGVRSMLGGHRHGAFADTFDALHTASPAEHGAPWGGGSDQLGRQAGLDDIGRAPDYANEGGAPQGFMDADADEALDGDETDFADEGDFDSGDDGGFDTA
jgi:hypothetical protein